jgi:vitamin B12 transporter
MGLKTHLLISAALVVPQAVFAQGVIELDEAIVTSGLIPVEVNRTGASVEVLNEDEIRDAGQSIQNALARRPGVSVVANGGLGSESTLGIRGLGETYIGVTYDGIEVTDPAAPTNTFAFGQLSRAAAGRIELAKGTQTAIYGSDAIAGAVNITSWRPSREGFSWGAAVEAGSYGTYSGALHMGLLDDETEIAFTASRIVSDGYSALAGDSEADGFEQTLLTFSIERRLSESFIAGVTFFHSDDETEYDAFGSSVGLSDGQRTGVRAFAKVEGERVDHELAVSHFKVERDEISGFGPFPFEGTRRKVEYIGRTELGARTELAFGADWTEEISNVGGVVDDGSNGGLFGEVNVAVSDRADVSFSLRHDVYSDVPDQTTGRVAGVYRAPGDLTFTGTFGTGYRAPSLQERFGFGGDPTFVPEDSIGGDLGVRKDFADGSVSATIFRTEIDNLIRYDNTTFSLYQTPGTTVSQGVELAAGWNIGQAQVYAAYTYTDARTEGARLVRVPRHDLVFGVDMPITERLDGAFEVRHVMDLLDVDTATNASMPLEDYTVANLTLGYQVSDTTEAYIRVENLFGEDYQTTLGYNAPARSVFVGVRAEF